MNSLDEIKIAPRDQQVLDLLVHNKEIARELNISARTVKQHLRTLFLRAGIRESRKASSSPPPSLPGVRHATM